MKFGKTIKIFLLDGDPNGRMSCERFEALRSGGFWSRKVQFCTNVQ